MSRNTYLGLADLPSGIMGMGARTAIIFAMVGDILAKHDHPLLSGRTQGSPSRQDSEIGNLKPNALSQIHAPAEWFDRQARPLQGRVEVDTFSTARPK